MKFEFNIARRYLFAKKSHHAINIISGISAFGVAVATAALVCILSVFNGFGDMVSNLFTAFDPELKIMPTSGKYVPADVDELTNLRNDPDVAVYTEVVEDQALLSANNRQVMVTLKGVDSTYTKQTDFERIREGQGEFVLGSMDLIDYGVLGIHLLEQLDISIDELKGIDVYAPRKGEHIDLNDPVESFNCEQLFSPRVAFRVKQAKYDANYAITSIDFARRLFERQGYVTAIELRLKDGCDAERAKQRIRSQLGDAYSVLDRYEQQEDTFRIMKVEKLLSYIFLTFVLIIASFNIIGSLSMLIIDKRNDVQTLRNLGANQRQVARIFLFEGWMISLLGAVIGIAIGLALCQVQQTFELIKFGAGDGNYIINAYPVSVHLWDIVLIFFTVAAVGLISVWYPVQHFSKKYTAGE